MKFSLRRSQLKERSDSAQVPMTESMRLAMGMMMFSGLG
ncbi:hypothetical protein ARTHRO9AX_10355 [Arthrobacter sp. 9AX]|nr:hypothetical protein ARTHRO9AX_10355 [Arthrobacter sp. 9AX]